MVYFKILIYNLITKRKSLEKIENSRLVLVGVSIGCSYSKFEDFLLMV